jgi:hypothetical protein
VNADGEALVLLRQLKLHPNGNFGDLFVSCKQMNAGPGVLVCGVVRFSLNRRADMQAVMVWLSTT